jgi:hypothetical protein
MPPKPPKPDKPDDDAPPAPAAAAPTPRATAFVVAKDFKGSVRLKAGAVVDSRWQPVDTWLAEGLKVKPA